MAAGNLKLLGIDHTEGQTIGGRGWEPELRLATEASGRIRTVWLTERDLLNLIEEATAELHRLRREREAGRR